MGPAGRLKSSKKVEGNQRKADFTRDRRQNMSQDDLGNKTASSSNVGGTGSSHWDNRERQRELRSELRELRHGDSWHGLIPGVILVIVGILFLAGNLFNLDFSRWWPLIPMAIGVAVLARVFHRGIR
jgi:hypothetical protein